MHGMLAIIMAGGIGRQMFIQEGLTEAFIEFLHPMATCSVKAFWDDFARLYK